MPLLLRRVRKFDKWLRSGRPNWLREGDAPADILVDLATSQNELSLWQVEDTDGHLRRIAAAVAATSQELAVFSFVLVDRAVVEQSGIALEHSPGDGPDEEANRLWHWGLSQMTTDRLSHLARVIWTSSTDVNRFYEEDLKKLIRLAIDRRWIDPSRIVSKKMRNLFV